jgi:hypothetical protein
MRKSALVFAFLLSLPLFIAAQTNSSQDVFTITVAAPISPQNVQVRYSLSGDPSVQQASSVARPDDNRILVETAVAGKPATGFRAIVYSPGCQFSTISADNLSASTRQADFQCQKLSTTPLHGKADISRFAGKNLQVEALYVCRWAGQFFGVPGLAISPFSVGKAKVQDDGSFALDLPDFSSDPLWSSFSHNATLTFMLIDAGNGERLAQLSAPRDLSRGGGLKVAANYPAEIEFAVR